MAITAISEWLNGNQDYSAGVKLYERFGNNITYKAMFANGCTAFTRSALYKNLSRINTEVSEIETPVLKKDTEVSKIETPVKEKGIQTFAKHKQKHIDFNTLPDHLKAEYQRRIAMLNEQSFLHGRLRYFSKEERAEARKKILQLDDEMRAIFKVIDEYDPNAPDPDHILLTEEAKKAILLFKEFKNIGAHISKLRGKESRKQDLEELMARKNKLEQIFKDVV